MKASIPYFGINRCGLFSILAVLPVLSGTVRLADHRRLVIRAVMADVDAARLVGANKDPANWMTYGRTYSEQRFIAGRIVTSAAAYPSMSIRV